MKLKLSFGLFLVSSLILSEIHCGTIISRSDLFTLEGTECYKCDNCATINSETEKEPCTEVGLNLCAVKIEGGQILRGCASDCETDNCHRCPDTLCNAQRIVTCWDCSSADNPNCLTLAEPTELIPVTCAANQQCRVSIGVNGETIRGCSDSEPCTGTTCKECNDADNCNGGVFPSDRLKCYHCAESDVTCFESQLQNANVCPKYVENDECYTYVDDGKATVRGCMSDETETKCSENLNHCVQCIEDSCNKDIGESEGKCIICDEVLVECANPTELQAEVCNTKVLLGRGVQCFTEFNDDKIGRGCFEDQDPSFQTACNSDDACETCVGESCNTNTALLNCWNCNSAVDPNCLTLVETVGLTPLTCAADQQCRVSIGVNGETIRGCSDSVPCTGTTCKECNDADKCNGGVFPSDRLKCYHCAESDATCFESQLQNANVCPKYVENDECYTYVDDVKATVRGCMSDETETKCSENLNHCVQCIEDSCNKDIGESEGKCIICDEVLVECANPTELQAEVCNTKVLLGRGVQCFTEFNDDKIGRGCFEDQDPSFQTACNSDDACETCVGESCNTNTALLNCWNCNSAVDPNCLTLVETVGLTPLTCAADQQCRVSIGVNGETIRGCSDSVPCTGTTCKECNDADKCNGGVFPSDRLKCYHCAESDATCFESQLQNANVCPKYVENDECYTYVDDGKATVRGCMSDETETKCSENLNHCVQCTEDSCNKDIGESEGKCIICDEFLVECANPTELQAEVCNTKVLLGRGAQCFTLFNADKVSRGCFEDLDPSLQTSCNSNDACETCVGESCNTKTRTLLDCWDCNSADNPNCLTLSETTDLTPVTCAANQQCRVSIGANGETIRGCSDSIPCTGTTCKECNDADYCNGGVFPSDRLKCYHCADSTCFDSQLQNANVCPKYVENDECYTYVDDDKATVRGCMSDETETKCSENLNHCVQCTEDSCNKDIGESEGKCIICDEFSVECANPTELQAEVCNTKVLLGRGAQCFTLFSDDKVSRGCFEDLDPSLQTSCNSNDACEICVGESCNTNTRALLNCWNCNSAVDPNCLTLVETVGLTPLTCAADQRCRVSIGANGETIRGCSDSVPCTGTTCKECNDADYCNGGVFPSDRLKCYHCADSTCFDSQLQNANVCPKYVENDECYTYVDDDKATVRGCMSDETETKCSENLNHCVQCTEDSCNKDIGESEGKCIICDEFSVECANPTELQAEVCNTKVLLGRGAQCFTLFSDDKVSRGCFEDLDPSLQTSCNSNDACEICVGESCNTNTRALLNCWNCNSAVDPNCLTLVETVGLTPLTCAADQRCRVSIGANGETIRGCSDSVPCTGTTCKECNDADYCNGGVFPSDRLKCYHCADSTCFDSQLQNANVCPKYVENDECYTYVDDDKATVRGCMSDETETKCSENLNHCVQCTEDSCNKDIGESEGKCIICDEFSVECANPTELQAEVCNTKVLLGRGAQCFTLFSDDKVSRGCFEDLDPSLQTSCNSNDACEICVGESCNTNTRALLNCWNCNSAVDPNCLTLVETVGLKPLTCAADQRCRVSIGANGETIRGCSDSVPCTGTTCKECNDADNCNGGVFPSDRLKCYHCAESDATCFESQLQNANVCLKYVENDECYTYVDDVKATVRGCMSDETETKCSENLNHCVQCTEDSCNKDIGESEGKCIICDEFLVECANPTELQAEVCNTKVLLGRGAQCFTFFNDDKVSRGCLEDQETSFQNSCNSNDACETCVGESCNTKTRTLLDCWDCNSADDPNCLTLSETTDLTPVTCAANQQCRVSIGVNGETIRGCSDSVPCTGTTCKECNDADNCNDGVFPPDRLKCYVCNGDDDDNCSSEITSTSVVCPVYAADNECYISLPNDSKIMRGCVNDENAECDSNCKKCNMQGCNNAPVEAGASLKCIKCADSSEECKWGFSEDASETCTGNVMFYETEACYQYDNAGDVSRGCLLEDPSKCLSSDEKCVTCTGLACNKNNIQYSTCIMCDSTVEGEESCADIPTDDISANSCTGVYTYANRGCYTFNKETHVTRGCLSALTNAERTICNNEDDNSCDICQDDEEGCNNKKPSSATSLQVMSLSLLLGIFIFVKTIF